MNTTLTSLAAAIVVGCAALTAPAFADETAVVEVALQEDDSAAARMDYAGKLRMLSQRVPSAACHLAAGIDSDGAKALLVGATTEFSKILKALELGDPELNINSPEDRLKTVKKIQELAAVWDPVKTAADAMVAGDITPANLAVVLDQNMGVLDSAKLLVTEVVGEYANPFIMVQADAFLIDIAGRQRMLTQKISKESCMISSGLATADTADALTGSMNMFGTSLGALRDGMPSAGIRKPPTAAIADGLAQVLANWTDVKPTLDAVLAGNTLDAEAEARKFSGLNATMAIMNKVVGMYTTAVKKEL